MLIDAKLHEPAMSLEWQDADRQTKWDALLEVQLAYMAAVGVDRAIVFPAELAWGHYAYSRQPERFAIVPMIGGAQYGGIDALSPDIAQIVADLRGTPGVVAVRVFREEGFTWDQYTPAFDACARAGLPVFLTATGDLEGAAAIARQYPGLTIVIDNIGLPQNPGDETETPPFKSLPKVLELAAFPNVSILLTSMISLSARAYPFSDIDEHFQRLVDAFGAERLIWGSDLSRFIGRVGFNLRIPGSDGDYAPNHSYAEALFYIRESSALTADQKRLILGGAIQKLLGWPERG